MALQRLRGREARHILRRWWVGKYRLPPTSDAFLRYTPEELLIEFFEDALEKEGTVRALTNEETGATYYETGDPLIDKWEREIAAGRDPNLDEGLPAGDKDARAALRTAAKQAASFDGIDERYD